MEIERSNDEIQEDDAEDLLEFNICKENELVVEEIKDPEVGMEFSSIDECVEYYMEYGVTRSKSQKLLDLRHVRKTGCKANVRAIVCPDGKWCLSTVTLDHNHDLSPEKSRFYKKNRIMRCYIKRRLELNDRAGIRPNKNFNSFVVEAGGHENVPFLQKDCYNYLDKVRRLRLGNGDATALQNYFQKMQANNSNFFYLMGLDDDGRLRNVFWADARSRAACEEFGDVITFDTTYLTNKYDMSFAPFVGVNHHGQSILLDCGLISSEDINSFTWLFESWLVCMKNRAPSAIITDQDRAMKKAIEIVFPNTRHRWCLWHIMKKCPEKLRGYNQYESIKFALQSAVYDSLTCEDFEGCWSYFINKFNLQENEWLDGLYNERNRWVPAFLKNTLWAGMSSTQRSESMNAFFDGYVNSKTSLKQFVEQYENALRSKVQKENEADFNSFDHWIPCITTYSLEKQFQNSYTTAKFREFQDEVKGKLYCAISSIIDEQGCQVYDVTEDMFRGTTRRETFKVCFKKDDCDIKCNCQLFEFRGILCRHALPVLLQNQVYTVPDKFILQRWRKDLKMCHTKVKIIYSDWTINPENERFDRMCNQFYEAADLATGFEEKTKMVIRWIQLLTTELQKDNGTCDSCHFTPSQVEPEVYTLPNGGDVNPVTKAFNICSPLEVHKKGRPRFKRLQSRTEQVIRKKIGKQKKKDEKGKGKGKRKQVIKGTEKESDKENGSQGYMIHDSQCYLTRDYIGSGSLDLNQVPNVGGFPLGNTYSGGEFLS